MRHGFLPFRYPAIPVVSLLPMHWIANARFREAIDDFLVRETQSVEHYMQELGEHAPYKQE